MTYWLMAVLSIALAVAFFPGFCDRKSDVIVHALEETGVTGVTGFVEKRMLRGQ